MKTMAFIQILFFLGILSFSCAKDSIVQRNDDFTQTEDSTQIDDSTQIGDSTQIYDSTQMADFQWPLYDSLKGNWNWYAILDAQLGRIKNKYTYEIRFMNLNNDSTVSFETYRNDTLKARGKLTISKDKWGRKIEPKLISEFTVKNEIYFRFLSKDTIELYEACCDCPFYYFSRE